MPEGDTVWRLAQRLHDALAGGPLTRCDLRVPRLATVDLTGRGVLGVLPRGKHLLTRFEGGLTLHSHLRMDGAWKIYAPAERWRGGPAHQIRAILGTADHTAVGYRLPVLDLLRTADESRVVGHLGPDLLGPDWDPAEALRRLLTTPERPLGEALLDQRNLAGIGMSTNPSCASCWAPRPGSRWGRCPGRNVCPRSPRSSSKPTSDVPPVSPRPAHAPTDGCGSTAGPAAPVCAAAPRSAPLTRTPLPRNASPTGAPPASRTHRTATAPADPKHLPHTN
ncbi:endonuclease-8 [Streptomyces sp. SceaMP-e96]|nr:endonuclease-8 [Streptomyces sp. SceaMP-e96]